MTIDEAIYILENGLNIDGSWHKALHFTLDTIRKYQKIEQIIKDDTYYEEYGNNAEKFIVSAISEVVEDGKID